MIEKLLAPVPQKRVKAPVAGFFGLITEITGGEFAHGTVVCQAFAASSFF